MQTEKEWMRESLLDEKRRGKERKERKERKNRKARPVNRAL
jgi:hypothetical protein